jgi:hypothetical protein
MNKQTNTPKTNELDDRLFDLSPNVETDYTLMKAHARKLERERDVMKAHARKLERERDELRKVVRHCHLFIVERKGYIADESLERELIKQEIDALIPENV